MTEPGASGAAARWMESLWLDVRVSVRGLLQNPGITIAALFALALGIGANTAVFSVAQASLWRDLPYRDPERLMAIRQWVPPLGLHVPVNFESFEIWRRGNRSFEEMASCSKAMANLTSPGEPALVLQAWATESFFRVTGTRMAAGEGFRPEDFRRRRRVAVISDSLFQERYGGEPSRLRQGIVLDGARYAVIGVAPPGFDLFQRYQVWLPDVFRPPMEDKSFHLLEVIGRLRPGVALEQADSELEAISRELAKRNPGVYEGVTVLLTPLPDFQGEENRKTVRILALFVACILLIACADVAALLLARATGREREVALRAALGSGRGRLVRRMLTESLLLFLMGGLLALPLALAGARGLAALDPAGPPVGGVPLSGGALLFTFGVSLATGIASGLAPALAVTGRRLTEGLKDAQRLAGRPAGRAARNLLVAAQVALTVVLLVGAGLLSQSFDRLRDVDPGFQPTGLLTLDIQLPAERYNDAVSRARLFEEMLRAVREAPGIEAAALADSRPFRPVPAFQFTVEGVPLPDPADRATLTARAVSPGYFETLRIPLVRGRAFRDSDGIGTPRVAVVNEAMANRYWPGRNPIGKRFTYGYDAPETPDRWLTIVGVARDARERHLDTPPVITAYSLLTQELSDWSTQEFSVLVRTPGDPLESLEGVRKAVRKADPALAAGSPRRLEDVMADSIARIRYWSLLGQLFAALALILALVGIYSVVSYSVALRTHEIGVRVALGARPGDVLRRIIVQGMAPILAGLVVGLGAARLLLGFLEGQLYEVSLGDPLPYVVAAVVVLGAGLLATYFPAHRATQVDPMAALREE